MIVAHAETESGILKVYYSTFIPPSADDTTGTWPGSGTETFADLDAVKARWPDAAEYVCCDGDEIVTRAA